MNLTDCRSIRMIHTDCQSLYVQYTKKNTNNRTHDDDSRTKGDTNDEHTRIDEDEPLIEEKMREFERRNEKRVNEWCKRTNSQSVFHF